VYDCLGAKFGGGDDFGRAFNKRGGDCFTPESDWNNCGLFFCDGGHVGAGVGDDVRHGGAGNRSGRLQDWVWLERVERVEGVERIRTTTNQKLLQQAIQKLILIYGLDNTRGDCLNVVNGCRNYV